ncbi:MULTISPECIES: hypothetical protein [Bradyrhizobium]|uniref:hypothetical protein n=1 Tax=Bradyrhizobium TaxID=374 RepID=UPI0004B7D870|nr:MULTISPECIES: hypothetical protein [Bradyrhizobium]MCS3445936.1 hypothetical protein [Bradyrhizobium elkanii]MCS3562932.1 hypothetical protein [Bradyrhizobium elkanii]MCW2147232.1 hypothetical protein [Bradyrhizobium elkanii]MCW2353690.1 hypothetical protein [Bradyrhizobium elkanii]MCW2380063.1 hypothetical protein [Bradyrhizobium elkanii]
MSGVVGNWRVELIEAHRDHFAPPADTPLAAQGAPECGEGWRDLLDRMCVRIRAAVQSGGGTFKFSQIKEKYGTLRVYWSGALSPEATALVEEAIALAEARSATSCEVCGEPGRLYGDGWLTTRCAAHAEGRAPVEVRPGFENIHIVSYVAGDEGRVTCRRYDRESDTFTEVDPASLEIGEH